MKALRGLMWVETVLLVGLLVAYLVGQLDGLPFAYAAMAIFVVFAVPSFMLISKERAAKEAGNG